VSEEDGKAMQTINGPNDAVDDAVLLPAHSAILKLGAGNGVKLEAVIKVFLEEVEHGENEVLELWGMLQSAVEGSTGLGEDAEKARPGQKPLLAGRYLFFEGPGSRQILDESVSAFPGGGKKALALVFGLLRAFHSDGTASGCRRVRFTDGGRHLHS